MEHIRQPVASKKVYFKRVGDFLLLAGLVLFMALLIGTIGYKYLGDLTWIDSLYNASMILGGMGPVNELVSDAAKIFASFYALFSGAIFLGLFGLVFTPVLHRVLHRLHVEE